MTKTKQEKKRKENTTEAKQITARKPKGNKRKRKRKIQTILQLPGIEPATPPTPATQGHTSHLLSTISNLPVHTYLQAYPHSSPSTNPSLILYTLLFYETSS
jgi:hypothetical protein